MIALTEELLSGAGGWQAMKAARELLNAGRVSGAGYEPPLLRGEVREGQKKYRAGLRVRSALDIENLCTCRESREWGKVCAHSLAVGLAYLTSAPAVASAVSREEAPPLNTRFLSLGDAGARPLALHFILPPAFRSAWTKGQIMVCIEAEFDGRRVMLDALPRGERFGCDEFDLAALGSLGMEATAVNMLSAAAFLPGCRRCAAIPGWALANLRRHVWRGSLIVRHSRCAKS